MVRIMKKYLIIIIAIIIISNKNNQVITTFSEIEDNVYYTITSNELTTKNKEIFDNIKIISVTPYIPLKYQNKFTFDKYNFQNNKDNIKTLENNYLNNLTQLKDERLKTEVMMNGIKIIKLEIEANKEDLEYLKNKIKDIIIEKN